VATPAVLRVVEREARVFRRLWRGSVFSSLLSPVLFLAAMGVGLGDLIDQRSGGAGGVNYVDFIAPGLLAANTALVAANESLWPVMGGVKWMRTTHGIVATPIRPADAYDGLVLWVTLRVALGAAAFVLVAALFGAVPSPWGVLAIPAAALCGAAFTAPLAAFAATQETDQSFALIMRLGIIPLFLFSGTFYPISQLPGWGQVLARVSPLWHGVELCRSATTGHADFASVVAHCAVLGAFVVVGLAIGRRTFTTRLAA
jgi:lipooligosaccharide transport system permease protein